MSLQLKQLPQFTVIGPKCVGKSPAEMGQMWMQFIPRIGEVACIPTRVFRRERIPASPGSR